LAGGSLGAFGGFLDRGWRLNDFFVGRRAMRAHLQREELIPRTAFNDYLAWSESADMSTAQRLNPNSSERDALTRFAGLGSAAGAPTLQPHEMAVDMLPGWRIAYILRKLLVSTRRVLVTNSTAMPYRALSMLSPALPVLAVGPRAVVTAGTACKGRHLQGALRTPEVVRSHSAPRPYRGYSHRAIR
jgi:hypothetical protein